jgi:hypothetical protein
MGGRWSCLGVQQHKQRTSEQHTARRTVPRKPTQPATTPPPSPQDNSSMYTVLIQHTCAPT